MAVLTINTLAHTGLAVAHWPGRRTASFCVPPRKAAEYVGCLWGTAFCRQAQILRPGPKTLVLDHLTADRALQESVFLTTRTRCLPLFCRFKKLNSADTSWSFTESIAGFSTRLDFSWHILCINWLQFRKLEQDNPSDFYSFDFLAVGRATSCLVLQTYQLALWSEKCVFNCGTRYIKKGWLSITCCTRTHVEFLSFFFATNAILHFLLHSQIMLQLQYNLYRLQLPFELE